MGDDTENTLGTLLGELKRILNGDFLSARPVSLDRLLWKWPPDSLRSEVMTQKQEKIEFLQWILTGFRTLFSGLLLKFEIPLGPFKPKIYKQQLITNSDFKKFDETLRMVIDCTPDQASAIQVLFERLRNDGRIVFGIHKSSRSLMTCVVKAASANQHIHFIDGADGGYTLAATQMKAQTLETSPSTAQ